MMLRLGPIGAIVLATWSLMAGTAQAQPTLSPPTVVGATITFNWTATGASTYFLQAGVASGVYVLNGNVGNVTTYQAVAPAVGVYFVRIVDGNGLASNEQVVTVTSLVAPPAAPTNVQVFRNGTSVIITWAPGAGGGPVAGYRLRAGLTPGGSEVGVLPTATVGYAAGGVPPNTYYLGVSAVNAAGPSAEAAEAVLAMPATGACDPPPAPALTTTAWGQFLTATWTAVPGAAGYNLSYSGPGVAGTQPFGGGTTRFVYPTLPVGAWSFGIQAAFSCGATGAIGGASLVVDNSTLKMEPRAADPPGPTPPNYIPLPDKRAIVNSLAAQYPQEVRDSCRNMNFVMRVLARLRQEDKRWGLNWKRNNVGDVSHDVLDYNYGSLADEGSRQVHVVDIISGHCGPNPGPAWINQTVLFSTGATWTLIPYIEAGYTP